MKLAEEPGSFTGLKQEEMTTETDKGKSYQHKSKVLHLGLKENEPEYKPGYTRRKEQDCN